MTTRHDLAGTLQELQSIKIDTLTVEQRKQIIISIDRDYEELAEKAEQLKLYTLTELDQGNPNVLAHCRKYTGRISEDMKEFDELRSTLVDSVERSLIKERMAKFMGGDKQYAVFQIVISTLIMLVLTLLVYDIVGGPDAERPNFLQGHIIFWIDAACCVIFMSEFLLRLKCADHKAYVWRHHWVDFVTSIPIPGGAQLARFGRFARLARFLRFARLLRFLRLFFLFWRGMDKFQDLFDVRLMKRTLKWAVVSTILGAILVYYLEGIPAEGTGEFGEQVKNIPLAIWWSFTTVLTGGFGDIHNPVTVSGQILTAVLIIMGMILVGVFTATLTTIFVGEQAEEIEKISLDLGHRIDHLTDTVESLKRDNDS